MIAVWGESVLDLLPALPARPAPSPGPGVATDAQGGGGPPALWRAHPGGSAANVAVALARLGRPVTFLGRFADDTFGRLLLGRLEDEGVGTGLCAHVADPTALAVIEPDAPGGSRFTMHAHGTAEDGWSTDLPGLPPQVSALHLSASLALGLPGAAAALTELMRRERGRRRLSLDPNVRSGLLSDAVEARRRWRSWLELADVVKASEDDVAWLSPGRPVADVAREWAGGGPSLAVITTGADGAVAALPGGDLLEVPGEPTAVVDTVGAGDAFMAGLLDGLPEPTGVDGGRGLDVPAVLAALRWAVRVSARSCTRPGADPPRRGELVEEPDARPAD